MDKNIITARWIPSGYLLILRSHDGLFGVYFDDDDDDDDNDDEGLIKTNSEP